MSRGSRIVGGSSFPPARQANRKSSQPHLRENGNNLRAIQATTPSPPSRPTPIGSPTLSPEAARGRSGFRISPQENKPSSPKALAAASPQPGHSTRAPSSSPVTANEASVCLPFSEPGSKPPGPRTDPIPPRFSL